jgi:hypothetical protein
MSLQSAVNINLAFGVPGELIFEGPLRVETMIVNSNGAGNTVGFAFTKNTLTGVASLGGVVGGGTSSFTASIATTTMTVTAVASGSIQIGQTLAGITTPCLVTGYLTGSGGVGTYTVAVSQTFSSGAVTGSGGAPTAYAGILVNPKTYASIGTTAGTLTPTLNITDNSQGEFLTMGTICANLASGSANIGDQVQYNVVTGALTAIAPTAAASATNAIIANATIYKYPDAGGGGLVAVRLTGFN